MSRFVNWLKSNHKMDVLMAPISVDLIEPSLYLGGLLAAKDVETLEEYKITHILTINNSPLPRKITELEHITVKTILVDDNAQEDLLSHFDETEAFITEGMSKGAVLVHCYFGISRSATIVVAYFMKKYKLTYDEALKQVLLKRPTIHPNFGFVSQLLLYEEMGYKVDRNNVKYKKIRLNSASHHIRKLKMLPENFMDLIKSDPELSQSSAESNSYCCKKCGRILACQSNFLKHEADSSCTEIYFIEPLAWMNDIKKSQGKLLCPKCSNEVGSFNWTQGFRCPCGIKEIPAFYLMPSEINLVK